MQGLVVVHGPFLDLHKVAPHDASLVAAQRPPVRAPLDGEDGVGLQSRVYPEVHGVAEEQLVEPFAEGGLLPLRRLAPVRQDVVSEHLHTGDLDHDVLVEEVLVGLLVVGQLLDLGHVVREDAALDRFDLLLDLVELKAMLEDLLEDGGLVCRQGEVGELGRDHRGGVRGGGRAAGRRGAWRALDVGQASDGTRRRAAAQDRGEVGVSLGPADAAREFLPKGRREAGVHQLGSGHPAPGGRRDRHRAQHSAFLEGWRGTARVPRGTIVIRVRRRPNRRCFCHCPGVYRVDSASTAGGRTILGRGASGRAGAGIHPHPAVGHLLPDAYGLRPERWGGRREGVAAQGCGEPGRLWPQVLVVSYCATCQQLSSTSRAPQPYSTPKPEGLPI